MIRWLKRGTAWFQPTRYSARHAGAVLVALSVLFSTLACSIDLASVIDFSGPQPTYDSVRLTRNPILGEATALMLSTTEVPATSIPTLTPTDAPPVMYSVQPGDTLQNLAARFGVEVSEIKSAAAINASGLLPTGQAMLIPRNLGQTSPTTRIIPDSEVVYSPTSLEFDIKEFVGGSSGYLKDYQEYLGSAMLSGAQVVMRVAVDYSINPRLLLALLEYQAHWITAQPGNLAETYYPLGWYDISYRGLYRQLVRSAQQLSLGYYGWRAGTLIELTFPDQSTLRLAPEVNAGTAALQVFFARSLNLREWSGALYASDGFMSVYENLFGSPWTRDQSLDAFMPDNLQQPPLDLPFQVNRMWAFTGGPHAAWSQHTPRAALDFAPASDVSGCAPSKEWVLAPAAGRVLRSENGLLVLDLDGDGREQTGWVLIILHLLSDRNRPAGTLVAKDEPIGYPSCEAGLSTGTHIHLARKYNGEWMLADGAVPFNLSGWTAHNGEIEYQGYLTNNGKVVTADFFGSQQTQIIRQPAP